MSTPDLLERVRMCLAEVGAPTDGVRSRGDGTYDLGDVDYRTAWMAWSLAALPIAKRPPICLACAGRKSLLLGRGDLAAARKVSESCLATRPCMEDCGLDRSAS